MSICVVLGQGLYGFVPAKKKAEQSPGKNVSFRSVAIPDDHLPLDQERVLW